MVADNSIRPDGTTKGPGFLGTLKRPDGTVSSELSVTVNMNGEDVLLPTLVPTLTQQEVDFLLAGNKPTKSIMDKAIEHAIKRIKQGKSPFAEGQYAK